MAQIVKSIIIAALLTAVLLLVVLTMSVLRTGVAHATYRESAADAIPIISTDNQTAQETEEEIEQRVKQAELSNTISTNSDEKLYSGLEEKISTMKPTDDITLYVLLIMPADITNKIYEATAPIDKAIEEISTEILRRGLAADEEFEIEFGAEAKELLHVGDSTAVNRYREIQKKHGADTESRGILHLEIEKLREERNKKVSAILIQQYGESQASAKQKIEALPETKITGSSFNLNSLEVQTKVINIEALIEMPEVVRIYSGEGGVITCVSSSFTTPLHPSNSSIGYPADHPSFSWVPYKETTKYKFVLAEDAAMTKIVTEPEVAGTDFLYDGTLDYSTNYFWRVMALEPAPSDWSATISFRTESAPPPPAEPQTQPQPISWPLALTIVIILTILLCAVLITWLVVVRRSKAA